MRSRRQKDHFKYYLRLFAIRIQDFLMRVTTLLSFIAVIVSFVFVVYYLFYDFRLSRVIAGCFSVYTCIHLNNSLNGRW